MEKVYNESLDIKDVGKEVTLCGWVAKKRNLGGLIFIDLRDRSGLIQLAFNPENPNYDLASSLKSEYVIKVFGKVVESNIANDALIASAANKSGVFAVVEIALTVHAALEIQFVTVGNKL